MDFLNCPRFRRVLFPFYYGLPENCSAAVWPLFVAAMILIPATTLQAMV